MPVCEEWLQGTLLLLAGSGHGGGSFDWLVPRPGGKACGAGACKPGCGKQPTTQAVVNPPPKLW